MCGAWIWAGAAAAQVATKPAPRPAEETKPTTVVEVFHLVHANAEEMVGLLSGVLDPKNARLAADARTNSVVIQGTPETTAMAEAFVKKFDQPAASKPAQPEAHVRVYRLKYADASAIGEVLGTMLGTMVGGRGTRVAVDKPTNSLVVAAPEEMSETVAQILENLDVPEEPRGADAPRVACQLRIVWLASGLAPEKARAPAEDLSGVVAELAGLGVKDVGEVGQVLVNTLGDGHFMASCCPLLDGEPTVFNVQGNLEARSGSPVLNLRLSASLEDVRPAEGPGQPASQQPAPSRQRHLVDLETIVAAPRDGSFVVLGVAPIGKNTSVFVVQVKLP